MRSGIMDNFTDFLEEEKKIFDKMDDAAEAQDWELYDKLIIELDLLAESF